jgi:hypothetical protein
MRNAQKHAPSTQLGHDARSIRLSTILSGGRRLDAESYLAIGNDLRGLFATAKLETVDLGSLADVWQPSRLKGILVPKEHGVPFYTATQVFDTVPIVRKWLSIDRTPDLDQRYIKPGWIVVTRSGMVGDATVAHRPHEGVIISDDLLRVVPRLGHDSFYIYAYLRTKYARQLMRSTKYGNVVKHLEPEHLQCVPVPTSVMGPALRQKIIEKMAHCFVLRDEAADLAQAAYAEFSIAVGEAPLPQIETGFTVHAADVFPTARRLDGKSFSPKAVAALSAVEGGRNRVDRLRELASVFGVKRFKHIYTATGAAYVDSGELFVINPEIQKFIPLAAKKDATDYYVKAGWLLMACSGQLYGIIGDAVLATRWHEEKVLSNHILRIVPKSGMRPGYLLAALTHTDLGRPLVLRAAFGTSIPELDPIELGAMPIVRLGRREDVIADKMERAAQLRGNADDLENDATELFESAISRAFGEIDEDAHDATIAGACIRALNSHPEELVVGEELEGELEKLLS